ncbi:MAG TPA: hypothetical protein VFU49_12360, partial [Ktedonobacteraceae bacterium]|nr:hypothetical protein [Ktedonobacteraceae bacterium]
SWGRLDLMSPDFQLRVENLFIQFMQRNRSFFGEQGRKRMPDIRMSISTSAASVVQGLRGHLAGQQQGIMPFGSPRPVVSWTAPAKGYSEPTWEQISAATMVLQQQLQELRGEIKPATVSDARPAAAQVAASPRQPIQARISSAVPERERPLPPPAPPVMPPSNPRPMPEAAPLTSRGAPPLSPAATMGPSSMPASPPQPSMGGRQAAPIHVPVETSQSRRRSEPLVTRVEVPPVPTSPMPAKAPPNGGYVASISGMVPAAAAPSRGLTQPTPKVTQAAAGQRDASIMPIGEDDMAIFDQMRHQLLVWMRIEAVKAGLDISNLGPAQLLEVLRQQGRVDETRLQVVSTLLNLSNQIVRTGMVSILDYKQALMFHLMHTKR